MARIRRIESPPPTGDVSFDRYMNRLAQVVNELPPVSVFSTTAGPNDSGISANAGTLGIDVGSANTSLWFNDSGATDGWSFISYI